MVLAPPPAALENPTKSMLIRQLLHCLMISFVKSKNEGDILMHSKYALNSRYYVVACNE